MITIAGMNLNEGRKVFLLACQAEGRPKKILRSYRIILTDFVLRVGNLDLLDLAPQHIVLYLADVKGRGLSPARYYRVVRAWLCWRSAQNLVTKAITEMIQTPKYLIKAPPIPEVHLAALRGYSRSGLQVIWSLRRPLKP